VNAEVDRKDDDGHGHRKDEGQPQSAGSALAMAGTDHPHRSTRCVEAKKGEEVDADGVGAPRKERIGEAWAPPIISGEHAHRKGSTQGVREATSTREPTGKMRPSVDRGK
jgi:hypothetical protein